jgi:sodium transport system ATP-binding protein
MIEAIGLRKRFGEVLAVDEVSFRAEDGAITGILGPNGAGKTTTLRMLYSLVRPDAGSATIDGCDVAAQPTEVRRRIGVLPDVSGLYPRLTAREHVRYFGRLHGLEGGELEGRIQRLLDTLDLGGVADRSTQGFSHGERMKVAIARALVHEPRTVLLDEPTNGLDVMSTRTMRGLIQSLRDDGKCVLFSSHIMQEVSALCDAVVVIAKGRVVARGTPRELLESTRAASLEDAFVQAIGSDEGLEK